MNGRAILFLLAFTLAAMGGCTATDEPAPASSAQVDPDLVAEGRALVVRECSACHAIDQNGSSPRAGAPPMNTVLARYNQATLVENLIEGVRVGHDDMPVFNFTVIAADAVAAYLLSLEKDQPGR